MQTIAFAPVSGHHIIAWLFIGLVAGALAGLVVRGSGFGFVRDIIVGLLGAVIGGLILHELHKKGHHNPIKLWEEIVVAFVGAVILLVVVKFLAHLSGRRSPARR